MKTTAWSHLPNAAHIDRVLASVKAHPDEWASTHSTAQAAAWASARDASWSAARTAAWDASWTAARTEAWNVAWESARAPAYDAAKSATRAAAKSAVWDRAQAEANESAVVAAWLAAGDAVSALVAWDHAAKYLDMTPDLLRVWYAHNEDPACLLLLLYAHARQLIAAKELTVDSNPAMIYT